MLYRKRLDSAGSGQVTMDFGLIVDVAASGAVGFERHSAPPTPVAFVGGEAGARGVQSAYLRGFTKRALDVVMALVLTALCLPVLLVIALAVRATSGGPAIFRQDRGGRDSAPFRVLKFRTMYVQDPGAPVLQATHGDSRVTPLGRILRKTSLDELPQLINVLKGDMSIVGPRPHAVEHDRHYHAAISGYAARYRTRPGMTGLAQVKGLRGMTQTTEDMVRRVSADLDYVRNASLLGDVVILVQTLWIVVTCRAAY